MRVIGILDMCEVIFELQVVLVIRGLLFDPWFCHPRTFPFPFVIVGFWREKK